MIGRHWAIMHFVHWPWRSVTWTVKEGCAWMCSIMDWLNNNPICIMRLMKYMIPLLWCRQNDVNNMQVIAIKMGGNHNMRNGGLSTVTWYDTFGRDYAFIFTIVVQNYVHGCVVPCLVAVLKIRIICRARDQWKLARSWKQLCLLCSPPDPWNVPSTDLPIGNPLCKTVLGKRFFFFFFFLGGGGGGGIKNL